MYVIQHSAFRSSLLEASLVHHIGLTFSNFFNITAFGLAFFLFGTKPVSQCLTGWVLQQGTFRYFFLLTSIACAYVVSGWRLSDSLCGLLHNWLPNVIIVVLQVVICLLLRKTMTLMNYVQVSRCFLLLHLEKLFFLIVCFLSMYYIFACDRSHYITLTKQITV